jgi:hypothetical protein
MLRDEKDRETYKINGGGGELKIKKRKDKKENQVGMQKLKHHSSLWPVTLRLTVMLNFVQERCKTKCLCTEVSLLT